MTIELKKQTIGLGTVQFGQSYGITNRNGQIDHREANAILNLANKNKVEIIDTSNLYGEAEGIVGKYISNNAANFRVITKTPAFDGGPIDNHGIEKLNSAFDQSLANLGVKQVYGVLVHHAEDLLCADGDKIFSCLSLWRQQGHCLRIGVSVYNCQQIDEILLRYPIDLIQVPLSVFDQRLCRDGTLKRLKAKGIEIHVRSIFLQGVILADPNQLPNHFRPFQSLLEFYGKRITSAGGTRLSGALNFIRGIAEIDNVIVGVSSLAEFREILNIYSTEPNYLIDYTQFACSNEKLINPMLWVNNTES